jgi:hypothetical protein
MEQKNSRCSTFYPFTLFVGVICPTKTTQINMFLGKSPFMKINNNNNNTQQHPSNKPTPVHSTRQ